VFLLVVRGLPCIEVADFVVVEKVGHMNSLYYQPPRFNGFFTVRIYSTMRARLYDQQNSSKNVEHTCLPSHLIFLRRHSSQALVTLRLLGVGPPSPSGGPMPSSSCGESTTLPLNPADPSPGVIPAPIKLGSIFPESTRVSFMPNLSAMSKSGWLFPRRASRLCRSI
jgi:hypothetical protein